jgi:hypothetical protein
VDDVSKVVATVHHFNDSEDILSKLCRVIFYLDPSWSIFFSWDFFRVKKSHKSLFFLMQKGPQLFQSLLQEGGGRKIFSFEFGA